VELYAVGDRVVSGDRVVIALYAGDRVVIAQFLRADLRLSANAIRSENERV